MIFLASTGAAEKRRGSCDDEAVVGRFDVGAQLAQFADGGGNAVGLLDAQFAGILTTVLPWAWVAATASTGSSSIMVTIWLAAEGGAAQLAQGHVEVGHRLAADLAVVVLDDLRPHLGQRIDNAGARRIDADIGDGRCGCWA